MPFTYNLLTSRLTQGNPVFAGGLRHCCVCSRIARCNVLPAEANPESRDSHEQSPQSSMIKVIVTDMRKGLPRQGQGELWRQIGSQAHYCNKKPMTPPEAMVSGSPLHSLLSLFIPWSKRTLGVHLLVLHVRKIDGKCKGPGHLVPHHLRVLRGFSSCSADANPLGGGAVLAGCYSMPGAPAC